MIKDPRPLILLRESPNSNDEDDYLCELLISTKLLQRNSASHKKLKGNFAQLTNFIIPELRSNSNLRPILLIFIAWGFIHDDILDNNDVSQIPGGFRTIQEAHRVFLDILNDEYGHDDVTAEDTNINNGHAATNFPMFEPLTSLLMRMHILLHQLIPNYKTRSSEFLETMRVYLTAPVLMSHGKLPLEGQDSVDLFRTWLRLCVGVFPGIALTHLIRGTDIIIHPSKKLELSQHPFYTELCLAAADVVTGAGEIFGVSKDIDSGELGNLILFKVRNRGMKMESAFLESVQLFNERIRDMITLTARLSEEYSEDGEIQAHLETITNFAHGNIVWCALCKRYNNNGSKGSDVINVKFVSC
jgi:hypothetical protein